MTSLLSWSYCWPALLLELRRRTACRAPLGVGCFLSAATHFVKSGGSGTRRLPPCAWPAAALVSQRSNSFLVIVESPTLATELEGTSSPQPATTAAPATASKLDQKAKGHMSYV